MILVLIFFVQKIKIARENPWSWKVLSIESDKKRPWWKSDKRRRQEIKSPTKSLTAVVKKYTLIIKMRPIKSESVIFQKPSKILKMRAWSFKTHPSPSFWKFRRYHKSCIVIKKHNNDLGLKNHPTPKHQNTKSPLPPTARRNLLLRSRIRLFWLLLS